MKTLPLLLAASLAAIATSQAAHAQDYVYMLSAGELRGAIDQGKRDQAIYYISGVMDSLMRTRDFCVPADSSPGVVGARAFKMMGQQPRDSMAPAADVLSVYLHSEYPCKK